MRLQFFWSDSAARPGVICLALLACSAHARLCAQGPGEGSAARPQRYVQVVQDVLEWEMAAPVGQPQSEAEQRDELLQSEAMIEALVWLDQYFAVQVDYSAEQVAEFHDRLKRMSPVQLRRFLSKFQQEREQRRRQYQRSERLRDESLARTAHWQHEIPQWHSAGAFGRNPFQTRPPTVRRHPRYGVYPPLITSRDVAALTLYDVIFDN